MELNDHEKHALSIFHTLTNNNICTERLIQFIDVTEEEFGNESKINWFKIALKLDSKRMVDALFSKENPQTKIIKKQHINEALLFGAVVEKGPEINPVELITIKMNEKRNPGLTTLDYLLEREKYFFNQ